MSARRLVVSAHSPRRTWLARAALMLGAVLVAGGAHELGRHRAERAYRTAADARETLTREVAGLRRRNEALRERVAVLETSREINRESYRELEQSLESLQTRLQARQEELQFYRDIVAPEGRVGGLRIERFRVEPRGGNRHRLRMVLAQALRQRERVEGRVSVRVDGTLDGEPRRLDLGALRTEPADENGSVDLRFSFRYFQDFMLDIELPEGFVPRAVEVELAPESGERAALTRRFAWPDGGSGADAS